MKPEDFPTESAQISETARVFGQRGWCLATGGNFSARVSETHCLITQSGKEKSILSANDLMICDLAGNATDHSIRASAETPLHTLLYRLDGNTGSVLHTHSVTATILSQSSETTVSISGFEMQKAIAGVKSHEETLTIPVFENNQDMQALAGTVEAAWRKSELGGYGFLVRGHGLYAWGKNVAEARRHVEGLEFLLDCVWRMK